MPLENVLKFRPYPLEIGQKMHITEGPRKGDWEVVEIGEKKVTLRCPLSGKEVNWARFCYSKQEKKNERWPLDD